MFTLVWSSVVSVGCKKIVRMKDLEGAVLLVAEDVPVSRKLLKRLLTHQGAVVHVAADGQEAVSCVNANPGITGVLMDIQMPNMNGIDATRLLRNQGFVQPIVAVTAATELEAEGFDALGFSGYIPKPVIATDLVNLIRSLLAR